MTSLLGELVVVCVLLGQLATTLGQLMTPLRAHGKNPNPGTHVIGEKLDSRSLALLLSPKTIVQDVDVVSLSAAVSLVFFYTVVGVSLFSGAQVLF